MADNKIKTASVPIMQPSLAKQATQGLKTAVSSATKQMDSSNDAGMQSIALGVKTATGAGQAIKLTGNVSESVVNGALRVRTAVKTTARAVVLQGRLNGTAPHVQIPSVLFQKLKNAPVGGVRLVGKGLVKTGNSIAKGGYSGIKSAYKGAENTLAGSDNVGLQGIGVGAKTARATIKTVAVAGKATTKTISTGVKVVVKTAKTTVHAVKRVNKYGIKDTVKYAKKKAVGMAKKAAAKAGQAIMKLLGGLAKKALIPLLAAIFGVVATMGIMSGGVGVVAALFSGTYTEKDTNIEVDIHSFLISSVEARKPAMTEEILEMRKAALEDDPKLDVVRLITPRKSIDLIWDEGDEDFETKKQELTEQIVEDLLPTEKYVEYLQPLFQSLLVSVYDIEPTKAESSQLFEEVWSALTVLTEKRFTEWCSSPCGTCGARHASSKCYSADSGVHSSKTCSCCGTRPIYDAEGNYTGSEFYCNGYSHCNSHKVHGIYISIGNIDSLMRKYFTDEIARLEKKSDKTAAEIEELSELKGNYELCLDYIEEFKQNITDGVY